MSNLIGQSLGRYHILEQLGEGGMAIVYKAYDTRLETEVAVKVIRTENLAPNILQRALKRFEREAKALARLTHPNIVKVTDYGEYEGKPYLVMPYFPGGTLKEKMGKPIPWQEMIQILLPIAEALDYAHSQNMIHRDVKPSNILLTQRGQPMLTDFGIAKILDLEETQDLTGTSAAIGTPEYMAPEQATGKSIDHRADIYSLGIVLYEMATGRKPFMADTPMAVLIMHAHDPLPNPKTYAPNLPDSVEKLLLKALAKKPEDRYQNMEEFVKAMEGLSKGKIAAKKIIAPKAKEESIPKTRVEFKLPAIPRRTVVAVGLVALIIGLLAVSSSFKSLSAALFPTATPSNTSMPEFTATASITPTPSNTPTLTITPTPVFLEGTILDEENFENGMPGDWNIPLLPDVWKVVRDDSNNFVLRDFPQDRTSSIFLGKENWTNYRLEFRVKFEPQEPNGKYGISTSIRCIKGGTSRYQIYFDHNGGVVDKATNKKWETMAPIPKLLKPGQWNDIRINAFDGNIQVYVNNTLAALFDDPSPHLAGKMNFETDPLKTIFSIDEVRVTELLPNK